MKDFKSLARAVSGEDTGPKRGGLVEIERSSPTRPGYLQARGSKVFDAEGGEVRITGVAWFGLELDSFAPHGLWARSLEEILDQIVRLGFNTIRLPYSNQLFRLDSRPKGIDYELNPGLRGLQGVELLDVVVAEAGKRHLKIILDRHRPDVTSQSTLWYSQTCTEDCWIGDWRMLAKRYAGKSTVVGADLHNEPHAEATWGTGDLQTDWRLAAERAGNAILELNSDLLIIVEGIEKYQGHDYWWGGNLMGVAEHPVRLAAPDRLVYSPHDYGPGVWPQRWFESLRFPGNLRRVWDRYWGYISKQGIAPILVGEFGGRSVGTDKEGIWQRELVRYIRRRDMNYTYWCLNPESEDTGGVLEEDWQSPDLEKLRVLSTYQWPLID